MAFHSQTIITISTILLCCSIGCEAVRCYQCSSDTDPDGQDLCGAYEKFNKEQNIPAECNDLDSKSSGTFCVKITKQGPRGFIWDGRFRQVIRRCASVSSTGVTGVCNWGVEENGDYIEECSCSEDGCNAATGIVATSTIFVTTFVVMYTILSWS